MLQFNPYIVIQVSEAYACLVRRHVIIREEIFVEFYLSDCVKLIATLLISRALVH